MLLQNRNAFGHAFIKDIPGNAGDKPLQPTFPDKGGRLRSLLFFTLQSHAGSDRSEPPQVGQVRRTAASTARLMCGVSVRSPEVALTVVSVVLSKPPL
jgi:hypothetical protein